MSDDLRSLLLQSLAGGGQPDLSGLLSASVGDDSPAAALLARYLAAAGEARPTEGADDGADADDNGAVQQAEREAAFRRLRAHVEAMYGELAALRERNEDLAAALGACACWGDDLACPACGGDGAPGWRAPDVPLLRAYALPALRHLRPSRPAHAASAQAAPRSPEMSFPRSAHERRPA